MTPPLTAAVIAASLCASVLLGMRIRRHLPDHHLNADTKDTVKLAMGLVATMSALLLGLLVSSAKGTYDTVRGEVIQMAAKATLLDRVLGVYGTDAAPLRGQFQAALAQVTAQMWAPNGSTAVLNPQAGDALYVGIQSLAPRDDTQRMLKAQASNLAMEIGQLRTLLHAQSLASISRPLLIVVVLWLVIIFFSFSVLAPPNTTAGAALMVSALAVAGAIFLILEMDRPFSGLIQVTNEPMVNALNQARK